MASVHAQLDAARQLQLAREHWAFRASSVSSISAALGATLRVVRRAEAVARGHSALAGFDAGDSRVG